MKNRENSLGSHLLRIRTATYNRHFCSIAILAICDGPYEIRRDGTTTFALLARATIRRKADLCPREDTLKRPTDSTSVKQAPPISRACTYTRSFVST